VSPKLLPPSRMATFPARSCCSPTSAARSFLSLTLAQNNAALDDRGGRAFLAARLSVSSSFGYRSKAKRHKDKKTRHTQKLSFMKAHTRTHAHTHTRTLAHTHTRTHAGCVAAGRAGHKCKIYVRQDTTRHDTTRQDKTHSGTH
jgi:hypothetical protein